MIARYWHGRVPRARADDYLDLLRRTGLADIRATAGNLGAQIWRRDEGEVTHYEFVSFWESYEAIRRFAGADVEVAHYYDEDHDFLLELEPHVRHAEVVASA